MNRPPYSPQPRLIRDILCGLIGALITVTVCYIGILGMFLL